MPVARIRQLHVLAGVNGAGKSSIGGAAVRQAGADYYNPDEAASKLLAAHPLLGQSKANAMAWEYGRRMLERAIEARLDFAFETTLGANTMTALLIRASQAGFAVHIWYAGLATPEQHIERVKARVRAGGHDIPEADIRRRYRHSRLNLVRLLPYVASLRIFDNSIDADPAAGKQPKPRLVLHVRRGVVRNAKDLANTPDWAKPVVAAVMKLL